MATGGKRYRVENVTVDRVVQPQELRDELPTGYSHVTEMRKMAAVHMRAKEYEDVRGGEGERIVT